MKCGDCEFWDEVDLDKGECKRYPPLPLLAFEKTGDSYTSYYPFDELSEFPEVFSGDWCGEFRPKNGAKQQ